MNATTHALGPWTQRQHEDNACIYIEDRPDGFRREVAVVYRIGDVERSDAIARLITAAPDLRAALTIADVDQIIEAIENFVMGPTEDPELDAIWQTYIDKLNALRAAIVKAEVA